MRHPLFIEILTLGGIMLVLFLAISSVGGLIGERRAYQESVIAQVLKADSGTQTILGPVLVIPFTRHSKITEGDTVARKSVESAWYDFPRQLAVEGKLTVSPRRIGIYTTQVYTAALHMRGEFSPPALEHLKNSEETEHASVEPGAPYLAVFISDVRGIRKVPVVHWGATTPDVLPGSAIYPTVKNTLPGFHVPLPRQYGTGPVAFSFALNLQGAQALNVVPIGRSSSMSLSADWPHPTFVRPQSGPEPILPVERSISDTGFSARWESSWFANNLNDRFLQPTSSLRSFLTSLPAFSVSLIRTVDQYQLNARAIKYAFLFILLTFTCFFLFEIMRRLQVHPVQYALVGSGLAIFYLLLLALSEHVGFGWAYLLAGTACVGQIGFYVTFVLGGRRRGAGFTLLLAALYGVLFGLLQSEDNALLLGSLLLFAILTGIMIATRRFDWYSVGGTHTPLRPKTPAPGLPSSDDAHRRHDAGSGKHAGTISPGGFPES